MKPTILHDGKTVRFQSLFSSFACAQTAFAGKLGVRVPRWRPPAKKIDLSWPYCGERRISCGSTAGISTSKFHFADGLLRGQLLFSLLVDTVQLRSDLCKECQRLRAVFACLAQGGYSGASLTLINNGAQTSFVPTILAFLASTRSTLSASVLGRGEAHGSAPVAGQCSLRAGQPRSSPSATANTSCCRYRTSLTASRQFPSDSSPRNVVGAFSWIV